MKKIATVFIINLTVLFLTIIFSPITLATSSSLSTDYYSNTTLHTTNILENKVNSEVINMKEKTQNEIQKYEEIYGSKTYGFTAYILHKIQIFSIPLCFLGIAIGSIYQYVIGIRKLDVRDRGFGLMIAFVTLFVICQVLPLVFAIIVRGFGGDN